ncbi:DUF551 domain-containing protein [Salmonella enterica]|nr:DUF551 domain-containing protein [Salmonella enterica]EAS6321187.1 DUF551 domain-containing protein [Salmonella enterica]EEG8075120.1 DUF551 domain-containing protein [Salmonella enterica]EHY5173949.1 DUF551 domain-containing protein [Salmonella enterica]EII5449761.1 DUF551 domain-containing protein [Salmonella enterica]
MTTITRERLLKIQQWSETYGAGSNVMLPAEEAEELARIALAALEAAPEPVVPESISVRQAISALESADCVTTIGQAYKMGWNACRAAMLQRVENAESRCGNPKVSPDGWIPVSERMPEESGRYWCYVEEQNSLGKSHYQWNCSWNGQAWSDKALSGRVTHWMPLPEPPQEEK